MKKTLAAVLAAGALLVPSVVLMQQIGILLVLIAMASLGPSITILLKKMTKKLFWTSKLWTTKVTTTS